MSDEQSFDAGLQAAHIVVHPVAASSANRPFRRVDVLGTQVGKAYALGDVVEFLRRAAPGWMTSTSRIRNSSIGKAADRTCGTEQRQTQRWPYRTGGPVGPSAVILAERAAPVKAHTPDAGPLRTFGFVRCSGTR